MDETMAVLGVGLKAMKRVLVLGLACVFAIGCGTPDVTADSVEDAMKEREAKAKALDAKEGKAPEDHSKEIEQDPQASGK